MVVFGKIQTVIGMLSIVLIKAASVIDTRQLSSIPSGWSALGCYDDQSTARALRTASFTSVDSMTIPSCINFCLSGGFDFAGVEFGRECYCDTLIHGPSAPVQNASECNIPCTGDASTICGAAQRINIFSTSPTPTVSPPAPTPVPTIDAFAGNTSVGYQFEGCVVDPRNPRGLQYKLDLSGPTTPTACVLACFDNGFQVMGLEGGSECWCDNYLPFSNNLASADQSVPIVCELPCNGDITKACGGVRNLQVYGQLSPPELVVQNSTICMDKGPMGVGRDSSNYFPAQILGINPQGASFSISAELLNPEATTNQQWILTRSFFGISISILQLVNNQLIPYGVLGNPAFLRPLPGESVFFTTFSSDTPSHDFCTSINLNSVTRSTKYVSGPTLAFTDGAPNQFAFCFNMTGDRVDLIYAPVANHPNYALSSCTTPFTLWFDVTNSSYYDSI